MAILFNVVVTLFLRLLFLLLIRLVDSFSSERFYSCFFNTILYIYLDKLCDRINEFFPTYNLSNNGIYKIIYFSERAYLSYQGGIHVTVFDQPDD